MLYWSEDGYQVYLTWLVLDTLRQGFLVYKDGMVVAIVLNVSHVVLEYWFQDEVDCRFLQDRLWASFWQDADEYVNMK